MGELIMIKKIWISVIGMLLLFSSNASANTYDISPFNLPSGFSVSGTIETDGTIGLLSTINVVSWNISISGTPSFSITPANSSINSTVFSNVTATAEELQVAFPDGVLQFNFTGPFSSTVPDCGNCIESGLSLARFDFGRNQQGLVLSDSDDSTPNIIVFNDQVVPAGETFYVGGRLAAVTSNTTAVPIFSPVGIIVMMGSLLWIGRRFKYIKS